MTRTAILTSALFVLWLLLSGVYKPLIIALGVASSIFTMIIVNRMQIVERDRGPFKISLVGLIRYLLWLLKEIAKADWAVTKVILTSPMSVQQKLINVPASQKTDIGKVIFANSITLTPGTITVETEAGSFLTHALNDAAADMDALADMDARVSAIETGKGAE